MDSILETQRQTHEQIERYEQALSDVLMQQPIAVRTLMRKDSVCRDPFGYSLNTSETQYYSP